MKPHSPPQSQVFLDQAHKFPPESVREVLALKKGQLIQKELIEPPSDLQNISPQMPPRVCQGSFNHAKNHEALKKG